MFNKNEKVIVGGKSFDYDVFEYLLSRFKEAFSHSSLTIESAFRNLDEFDLALEDGKNQRSYDCYQALPNDKKKEVMDIIKSIIVFKGSKFGVFPDQLDGTQKQVDKLYHEYFEYFSNYVLYYSVFDENNNFDKIQTFHSLELLLYQLPSREIAYANAYNMQKDNLDAFDYAMSLKSISIPDIIKINSIVVRSDPDKVIGFKKTNNELFNASFTPVDKTMVPIEMQKLMNEYNNNFGEEILDPNEPGILPEERMNRTYKIFVKEALFHIRFERIHPFNDGNGRTGRILMNYNLLRQNIAPVIITNFMSNDYKKFINDFNVEGLTQLLVNSSSQQMANWVSIEKGGLSIKKSDISPDNSKLAELYGYKTDDQKVKGFMKKIKL